jgi:hypothetical protein
LRTALAILVLYANTVAPWRCCCATAKALAIVPVTQSETPKKKPVCEHCCESQSDTTSEKKPAPKPCPCPIQERLTAGSPDLFVERAESVLSGVSIGFEFTTFSIREFPTVAILPSGVLADGPALRTADRMLKFHHRFLC